MDDVSIELQNFGLTVIDHHEGTLSITDVQGFIVVIKYKN